MSKVNFADMTRKELKKYVLSHPTDDEAIRELFLNRPLPNGQTFSHDLGIEETTKIITEKVNKPEAE